MTKKYSNPDCEDYNLGFKDGKAQAKKEILKKIDKLTKIKYYVHLVNECDCCMNGLTNLLLLKEKIK